MERDTLQKSKVLAGDRSEKTCCPKRDIALSRGKASPLGEKLNLQAKLAVGCPEEFITVFQIPVNVTLLAKATTWSHSCSEGETTNFRCFCLCQSTASYLCLPFVLCHQSFPLGRDCYMGTDEGESGGL